MLNINPASLPPEIVLHLPASKSISNRLLVMQHLYGGFTIDGLSESADTQVLQQALGKVRMPEKGITEIRVNDCGTAYRFMAALLCVSPGKWLLTGTPRLLSRPMQPLIKALQQLGGNIQASPEGLHITGAELSGGKVEIDGSQSSQFASALLLVGPKMKNPLHLKPTGAYASLPYFMQTLLLLNKYFEVEFVSMANLEVEVTSRPEEDPPRQWQVEKDWSAASYWYLLAALHPGCLIQLPGLSSRSEQADIMAKFIFGSLGVVTTEIPGAVLLQKVVDSSEFLNVDFLLCPDLVPAVAAACTGLRVKATLTGIANLQHKESNRAVALAAELNKTGCGTWEVKQNEMTFIPADKAANSTFPLLHTHNDHRLAMAFAVLGTRIGLSIDTPEAVQKSYPGFWDDYKKITG